MVNRPAPVANFVSSAAKSVGWERSRELQRFDPATNHANVREGLHETPISERSNRSASQSSSPRERVRQIETQGLGKLSRVEGVARLRLQDFAERPSRLRPAAARVQRQRARCPPSSRDV